MAYMLILMKYLAIGVVNTLITSLVIFLMMWGGQNIYLANATGYAIGIGGSFWLNSVFTFDVSLTLGRLFRFICICLLSYLVNLLALRLFYWVLPEHRYSGQLVGMGFYTLSGFLLNKYWGMQ